MCERLAREVRVRPRHLHERELERKPRVGALPRVLDGDREEVDEPQDGRLGKLVRLLAQELLRLLGDGERVGDVAHVLDEQQVPEMLEQVGDEPAEVLPLLRQLLDEEQRAGRVPVDDHVAEPQQRLLVDRADELQHGLGVDRVVRRRGELVERRHGVAERAAGGTGDERERRVLGLDPLSVGDPAEERHDLRQPRPLEHERLAARPHRREHLLQLGRAEHEHEVGWRLLDELEKCLPGCVGQLVRLVEDVDLRAPLDRLEDDALADLADVVDPALRGGVHLDHVERAAVRDREADRARLVGRGRRARRSRAVERLREDPRHRRLAGPARPGEEVRLPHLVVLDRVLQRPDDRLLADDLVEPLRAVLPVERRHLLDSSRWVNARPRAPSSRSVSPEVPASPARIGRSRGT